MEFSRKLKKLRAEKGISQQKLADMLFVSRSAVAKWENGLGLPSEGAYESLAEFFGVSKAFLTTDEPEKIVIEKNKKIKKLSGSMCAALTVTVLILIVYGLFRPVPYYATAICKEIEIQLTGSNIEITDEDTVEEFIDMINATTFRKSWRVNAGEAFPDTMQALLILRDAKGTDSSVMLCSTLYQASVFLSQSGTGELMAANPEVLSDYIVQLLENETAGSWALS